MIASIRHRRLKRFFRTGDGRGISTDLHDRCRRRLDALDAAKRPEDMDLPGFNFHALRGRPKRYSVHVSGNWCITFEWNGTDAERVDLKDYH